MAQHYPLTLEDAINLYKTKDLTAKGALKIWVRIRLKKGWSCNINPKELRDAFSMKRSTFWDAMHTLAEEGEIEFSEPNILLIKRPLNRMLSDKPDSRPSNRTAVHQTG